MLARPAERVTFARWPKLEREQQDKPGSIPTGLESRSKDITSESEGGCAFDLF